MATPDIESTRQRLSRLAWLLDSSIPLPGVKFRIGLDALIGLLPGIGDIIGVLLSSYIVAESARAGLPKSILARMVFNIGVEGVVGIIPLVGDLFDAGWKANQRNTRLLDAYLQNPRTAQASGRAFVAGMISLLVLLLTATGVVAFLGLRWASQMISA